jgi:hypothetical protein
MYLVCSEKPCENAVSSNDSLYEDDNVFCIVGRFPKLRVTDYIKNLSVEKLEKATKLFRQHMNYMKYRILENAEFLM